MDDSTRMIRNLVRGILNEFEELPIAVSTLRDSALSVGVLGNEAGVYGVCPKDTGGLIEDCPENRGVELRHIDILGRGSELEMIVLRCSEGRAGPTIDRPCGLVRDGYATWSPCRDGTSKEPVYTYDLHRFAAL
ncbi:hypothetical protein SRB5_59850 [Streptomyces sp. RB5]|uniref:Uncharacterized protein n=1 Tax=Streptomyces smaragdinus TaxID=2585196 RepID=A0A7K0CSU7_9ACTN|nr:hypothetical protein [Streptomyces smaragdinus]MQY15794.1 hypothetical protein [Streptomyces smaragdinus]